jgi:hypothetical protein
MITSQLLVAVLRRPDLWVESLRTLVAVAPRRWWRRAPYLPLPDSGYTGWRLATAHGDSSIPLRPEELTDYLEWRKCQHRS